MPEAARFPAGPRVRAWAHEHGVSEWMAARWMHLVDEPAGLLDGMLRRPPKYLRVNTLRTDPRTLQERLEARGFDLAPTDLDPAVLRIRRAPSRPGATNEHMMGHTILQDLASASAPLALQARPGETVADLAAAPGVKTLHVAGAMRDRGALVAMEKDPDRMVSLRANLERCGVTCAWTRLGDAAETPGEAWADRVLLDAPCTGEGTIPKDRKRRTGDITEIARLVAVQQRLVDAADRILRPGGIMVYATCTLAPEENEAQVQRLLERGYRMERLPFDRCNGEPLVPARTQWPGLELDPALALARRFFPGRHRTLGFFVARLRKGASA